MKVFIAPTEWWPVLKLTTLEYNSKMVAELSKREIDDLRRVEAEFNDWQKKLAEKFGEGSDYFELIDGDIRIED